MARRIISLIELLKDRYPSSSEKELSAAIVRGMVRIDGEVITKAGIRVSLLAEVIMHPLKPFVSRGGEKLAHALDAWRMDCRGLTFIDAGCSTGGFTDCLLSRGASLVYAVDVGANQLDWRLRRDGRVKVKERTNIMDVGPGDLDPPPHRAVADLSFRSLRKAAAHILDLTAEGTGIFLVKPQFEWKDPAPDFHGVVRGTEALRAILANLLDALQEEGAYPVKATRSPVKGRKGNREFFLFLSHAMPPRGGGVSEMVSDLLAE